MSERPSLRRPVLVAAFRGWNDGGQGASLAAGYLEHLVKPIEPVRLLSVLAALAPAARPGELRPVSASRRA